MKKDVLQGILTVGRYEIFHKETVTWLQHHVINTLVYMLLNIKEETVCSIPNYLLNNFQNESKHLPENALCTLLHCNCEICKNTVTFNLSGILTFLHTNHGFAAKPKCNIKAICNS
jgi:hypothetical protein